MNSRDDFSKRKQSAIFVPSSDMSAMNDFSRMTSYAASGLAKTLDIGHNLADWQALAELVNVHLSNLRAARERS